MRLAALFSDGMVVQRDVPVPVWGWAKVGESVTVEMAGRSVSAPSLCVHGNADGSSARGHRQQFGMVDGNRATICQVNIKWLERPGLVHRSQLLRRHMSDFTRKTKQSKQRRHGDSQSRSANGEFHAVSLRVNG